MKKDLRSMLRSLRAKINLGVWKIYHEVVCKKDDMRRLYCGGEAFAFGCHYCKWVELDQATKDALKADKQKV